MSKQVREIFCLLILFSKSLLQPRLGQVKARSLKLHLDPPPRVTGVQGLWPSSTTFPGLWAGRIWDASITCIRLTYCTTKPLLTYVHIQQVLQWCWVWGSMEHIVVQLVLPGLCTIWRFYSFSPSHVMSPGCFQSTQGFFVLHILWS